MQAEDLNLMLIDTHNPDTIGIVDLSNYGNTVISNPSFEITPPGFNKVNVLFTPQNVNIFSANDLKLGCGYGESLPDGIYKVKYSIRPNDKIFTEKTFMKVSGILCNLYKYLVSLQSSCLCGQSKNKAIDIKLLIEGAVSAANTGDTKLAYELYAQADKSLKRLNSCKCQH